MFPLHIDVPLSFSLPSFLSKTNKKCPWVRIKKMESIYFLLLKTLELCFLCFKNVNFVLFFTMVKVVYAHCIKMKAKIMHNLCMYI